MKIAILGAGKMGVWFARFFQEEGYSVVLADRNEKKLERLKEELAIQTASFVEAVQKANWILICVSMNAFENVAKTIGPHIAKGQIVMDICSVQEPAFEPVVGDHLASCWLYQKAVAEKASGTREVRNG